MFAVGMWFHFSQHLANTRVIWACRLLLSCYHVLFSHLFLTWWFIPLSKWVITLVINGISGVSPLITRVITHWRFVGWTTKYMLNVDNAGDWSPLHHEASPFSCPPNSPNWSSPHLFSPTPVRKIITFPRKKTDCFEGESCMTHRQVVKQLLITWKCIIIIWLVVWNIFYFPIYWE